MQILTHSMEARFANGQLAITEQNKTKISEHLATGYRINRSGDDAAGLSVSEKMRWQIRGLGKASDNIQNGISLIQVADGALEETHSVLQRMRELAVQAANDTNTQEDRAALQNEIREMTNEVDRIAKDTAFNSDIYPLYGKQADAHQTLTYDASSLCAGNQSVISSHGYTIVQTGHVGAYSFSYETVENASKFVQAINNLHLEYREKYVLSTMRISGNKAYLDIRQTDMDDSKMYGAIVKETVPKRELTVAVGDYEILDDGRYKLDFGDTFGYVIIGRSRGEDIPTGLNKNGVVFGYENKSVAGQVVPQGAYYMSGQGNGVWIQMGAKSMEGIKLEFVDATATGIGLTDVDVSSYKKAGSAMGAIDDAISKVSKYRSYFGAMQNRFEHAKRANDNTAENTQAAESRLRDADISEKMVGYARDNIVEQVGQAVLAQANQTQQGILKLLQ